MTARIRRPVRAQVMLSAVDSLSSSTPLRRHFSLSSPQRPYLRWCGTMKTSAQEASLARIFTHTGRGDRLICAPLSGPGVLGGGKPPHQLLPEPARSVAPKGMLATVFELLCAVG